MEENIFKYGDFEGILDNSDYMQMETWERGAERFNEMLEDIQQIGKASELWRTLVLCITDEIIDPLFGDGTSALMFGDKITSGMTVLDAFMSLAELAAQNNFATIDKLGDMKKRVTSTTGNRAARRAPTVKR